MTCSPLQVASAAAGGRQADGAAETDETPGPAAGDTSAPAVMGKAPLPGEVIVRHPLRDAAGDRSGPSPRGALLRSALIPGWGQLSTGHPWKAGVMFGSASALGLLIREETRKADAEADLARATEDPEEFALHRDRYDHYWNRRRNYVSWLLFLWFYNVLDAYVEGHFVDFDVVPADPGADAGFMGIPPPAGVLICLSW